jgi:hypothetical protein
MKDYRKFSSDDEKPWALDLCRESSRQKITASLVLLAIAIFLCAIQQCDPLEPTQLDSKPHLRETNPVRL